MLVTGAAPVGAAYLVLNCAAMAIQKLSCSKAIGPATSFRVWVSAGSTAAGGEPNLYFLGNLTGSDGTSLPLTPPFAREWTLVILQRIAGADGGTIEAEGAAWGRAAPTTAAVPTLPNAYSAPLDFTACGPSYVLQLDDAATATDRYTIWGTNDSTTRTPASAKGATLLGELRGGGLTPPIFVTGWEHVIVQCVAHGAATGLVGVETVNDGYTELVPGGGPGSFWKFGGNNNGVPLSSLGTLDAGDDFEIFVAGVGNVILVSDGAFLALNAPSGNLFLHAPAGDTQFTTSGIRRLTILNSGEVGIGAAGPSAGNIFEVQGAATQAIVLLAGSGLNSWVWTTGGQLHVGDVTHAFANSPNSIQFATASNGSISLTAQGSGSVSLVGGDTGATLLGNMNAGSSTEIDFGNTLKIMVPGPFTTAWWTGGGLVAFGPGTGAPDASTAVDIQNGGGGLGLGLPSATRAVITAIPSPKAGLEMFDTTNNIDTINVGSSGSPNFRKAAGGSIVSATNTSGQSIADGGAAATVTTWSVDANTNQDAAFNATSGVFVVPVAGFYGFTVGIEFSAAAAALSAPFRIGIFVGGVVSRETELLNQVNTLSQLRQVSISVSIQLAEGASVDFRAFQNSGGAIALTATASRNYLSIELVS